MVTIRQRGHLSRGAIWGEASSLKKTSRKPYRKPIHHTFCKTEQPELKLCLNAAWTSAIAVAATNPQRRSALLDRAPQASSPVTIYLKLHQIEVAPVQNAKLRCR